MERVVLASFLVLCTALFTNHGDAHTIADPPGIPPMVDTSSGRIAGKFTERAQVYTSVPYARPPVGELRWKDPQRPLPVPGIISAINDPPGCPQLMPCSLPLPEYICPKRVSEDCLYLNVYAPLNATANSMLPVMVFIHGGNFIRGYSGAPLYDGQYIANTTSTVVVTINYRLGAIGFLVFGKDPNGPRGNYGLRDQRMALEWVQENIKGFGGNPEEVTLWGQSAGAVSGAVHMASIKSAGLFNKAILESEPFGITLKTTQDAMRLGEDFAKELGCSDLDCLYKVNITDIAKAQNAVLSKIVNVFHVLEVFLQWTPTVDGVDLFDQPIALFLKGEVAPIPLIIGTTSEEAVFFIYEGFSSPIHYIEYDALQLGIFQTHYSKVHNAYPPSSGDQRPAMAALGTDYTFTCPTRYAVWGLANTTRNGVGNNPIWFYVFNHSLSFDGWGKDFEFCNGHSCHAVELPFVFNSVSIGGFKFTTDELSLAKNMTKYWTNFAHTGNPNDFYVENRLPDWDVYYVDKDKGTSNAGCMKFKTPHSEGITDYSGNVCRFWDNIGYNN